MADIQEGAMATNHGCIAGWVDDHLVYGGMARVLWDGACASNVVDVINILLQWRVFDHEGFVVTTLDACTPPSTL